MADLVLWTSLMQAAKTSDLPQLTSLLAQHPSSATINHANEHGYTLIHEAARRDNGDIAQALVDAGANVDVVETRGYAPIHTAAMKGHLNVARVLVSAGANLNVVTNDGDAPLDLALNGDYFGLAKLLATAGACIDPEYEAEHANELRLWTAVLGGDLDELRRRIDAGDSVDQAPQGGKARGWTALWLAVKLGREDAARMLIQAGADVDTVDTQNYTPLSVAINSDNFDMVKLLVESNANVNAAHLRLFPLHLALNKGNCGMARVLIQAGANVDAIDWKGDTPLHEASSKGYFEVAKLLIDAGANVQLIDRKRSSPLLVLLSSTDDEVNPSSVSKMFTLLTAAGATVDGATATISPLVPSDVIRAIVPEDTPFWLAANNDAPMLAAELASGLDPNMKTENGMTLMHWACAGDAPECVQLLLDAGPDKEAGDPKPIFYCMHESSDCLKCMINYGIKCNQGSEFVYKTKYPIYFALAGNSPACVTALVGAGAWVTERVMVNTIVICPLELALRMRPIPVDALRALLAAASERVLNEKINGMPPLNWAVESSTVEGVRVLVEGGTGVDTNNKACAVAFIMAQIRLAHARKPSDTARLTAIVDYFKSLPCFSEEQ